MGERLLPLLFFIWLSFAWAPETVHSQTNRLDLATHDAQSKETPPSGGHLQEITLAGSHTVITQSCRIIIPVGTVFRDIENRGVIGVGASNIEIEFAKDSVLRGSPPDAHPDEYKGYAIRLNGYSGVTIRGANISGFWCGLWATKANRLVLESIDASDNRRAFLKSNPEAEDEGDWLFGHDNDQHQWLKSYSAAIYIEDSTEITVRNCKVWHGQNALCLDRVTAARIYDNDFSFNSGWGLALWRSSRNVISRNALDFCVRGYSHGVYNRGQDSAGIFAFEQNNENIIVENSVTHGGDGFFGFAGREALGESGEHAVDWHKRRGNNDNLLMNNDFSYAAAHGIENTFSFGNKYLKNRIVGNAICGIWAGFSRESLIAGNEFEANGEMGYGLERGGVNIDHGGGNRLIFNSFTSNKCGIHLWGGANPDFEKKNWAKANNCASTGSLIAGNTFEGDKLALQFRGPGQVRVWSNRIANVEKEMIAEPAYRVAHDHDDEAPEPLIFPEIKALGTKHPVGARAELRGRRNIVTTEWGPWDHSQPLVRRIRQAGGTALYEIRRVPTAELRAEALGTKVRGQLTIVPDETDESHFAIAATEPGVHPYVLKIAAGGKPLTETAACLVATKWQVTFFKWPNDIDPRKSLDTYRELERGAQAVSVELDELSLLFGMRGPSDLRLSKELSAAKLGQDHFGLVARTRLPMPKGEWKFTTLSDDGVRLTVDGKPVIENWAWHGPTRDVGKLVLPEEKTVEIVVEYFQIDGYAVLEFSLTPDNPVNAKRMF